MEISRKDINLKGIPAVMWGTPSQKLTLYIHGQDGSKEEAVDIAETICGFDSQILSLDLPEHGERKDERNCFDPWHIVPELNTVMAFAKEHWEQISVFANSIGAWFSLLSFSGEILDHCLFVSPVLDMKQLTLKMMNWANVSEEQLKKERVIPTSFGQTLSLDYWNYVLSHPITKWISPTNILYGAKDHLMDYETVESFARQFHCRLTVMENGGHWFHTEPQMDFLRRWLTGSFKNESSPLFP